MGLLLPLPHPDVRTYEIISVEHLNFNETFVHMRNKAIDFSDTQRVIYMPFVNNYMKVGQLLCISHNLRKI